jgi:Protein of unknown function (DUF4231)
MTDAAVEPGPAKNTATWARLEDRIDWYDGKSQRAQRDYKRLKVLQLIAAAVVPVVAAAGTTAWVTAAAGSVPLAIRPPRGGSTAAHGP